jgi:hypothetical protein
VHGKKAGSSIPDKRIDVPIVDDRLLDRMILSELLSGDHDPLWFRAELEREILQVEPVELSEALDRLKDAGVVCVSGELVRASRCVLHLQALEMLAI